MRRTGGLQKKRAEIRTRDRGHILHRYFFSSSSKRLGPPLCAKVWPRSPRDDHRHLASVASHQRVLSTSSFFLFFFFLFSTLLLIIDHRTHRSSFHEGIPNNNETPPLVLSKLPPLLPTRGSPIFSVYLVTFFFRRDTIIIQVGKMERRERERVYVKNFHRYLSMLLSC